MIRPIMFFLGLVFVVNTSPAFANSRSQTTIESEFAEQFRKEMAASKIPGAAYVIVRGNKVSVMKTYGVRGQNDKRAINSETAFRLASVSKTFAAELTAMMVSRKAFSWEDPIVKYIPDFKLKKAGQAEAIRIKHVLSQSSGLIPNAFDGYLKGNVPLKGIVKKFKELEPRCKAGACYGYQNVLFSFIEEVLQRSTGKAYADLMQQMIFSPLAMKNASVGFNAFQKTVNKAQPHIKLSSKGPWKQVPIKSDFYKVLPAAGVNASITDMSKWLIAQLGHAPGVIPANLLATVRQPMVSTIRDIHGNTWKGIIDDAHYGIGWRVYEYKGDILYFHSGWVEGFRAVIAYSNDKQIGMVMLANAESRSIDILTADFWRLLLNEPSNKSSQYAAK